MGHLVFVDTVDEICEPKSLKILHCGIRTSAGKAIEDQFVFFVERIYFRGAGYNFKGRNVDGPLDMALLESYWFADVDKHLFHTLSIYEVVH